jgi:UMP-CMP kinase
MQRGGRTLKDSVKESWTLNGSGFAIVLQVDREVARERFAARSRAGDVFEKRFDEHEEKIGAVVKAMRGDSMVVIETSAEADDAVGSIAKRLKDMMG